MVYFHSRKFDVSIIVVMQSPVVRYHYPFLFSRRSFAFAFIDLRTQIN